MTVEREDFLVRVDPGLAANRLLLACSHALTPPLISLQVLKVNQVRGLTPTMTPTLTPDPWLLAG